MYRYAGRSLIPTGHQRIGFFNVSVPLNTSGPPAEATTNPCLSCSRYSMVISNFGSCAIKLLEDTVATKFTAPMFPEKLVVTVMSERKTAGVV